MVGKDELSNHYSRTQSWPIFLGKTSNLSLSHLDVRFRKVEDRECDWLYREFAQSITDHILIQIRIRERSNR